MNRISFLLVLMFLASCGTQDKQESLEKIHVSVDHVADNKAAFTNHSFIKLETKDDCLLENVVKVKMTEHDIYLLSSRGGNIFKFSKDGTFLWKLSKGNGVGELICPTDFYFDASNNFF